MFLMALAILVLPAFQSCSQKAVFQNSAVVPAAEGDVTVKRDRNNNYVIKINITNLAAVDRLVPAKSSYVVWMEAARGSTKNIGQITSSNRLNVTFETVATQEPTKIFVTAEEDVNVQYPGSMVVLTTGLIYK